MKEKIKSMKLDVTFSAVLSVALGVIFLFWPAEVTGVIVKAIAVLLVVAGVVLFINKLLNPVGRTLGMIVALLVALIGVWIFINPEKTAKIIPIGIGVLLVVHGIQDIALAIEAKGYKGKKWGTIIVFGLLNMVAGMFCIACAFELVKFSVMIIGIMLIYDGLTDMFIVHKVTKASKNVVVDSEILREEDIDNNYL